jgi:hypothetical protein
MWADGTELSAGERTVGALLDAGTYPTGLAPGSTALAVALDDALADADGATDVLVRVLDTADDDQGAVRVTLAVPEAEAARIARLAAGDQLALVGVPATPTDSPESADAAQEAP